MLFRDGPAVTVGLRRFARKKNGGKYSMYARARRISFSCGRLEVVEVGCVLGGLPADLALTVRAPGHWHKDGA